MKSNEHTIHIPIIFISALSAVENIVKGFQAGGVDYIAKPFRMEEVMARVRTHLTLQNAIREKEASQSILRSKGIYALVDRTADLDVNMLICGSSGTGKELVDEAIHRASPLVRGTPGESELRSLIR